ncbi:hypothetical protein JS562_04615 [Agrobacterium sp. S2]|nr:hypothetical protein [Agrobacterium sp. S2]
MIWKFLGVSDDEDFNMSAQGWFKLAIVAASVGLVFFVCSGLVVLAQQDANDMQKVSQAFAPFLVGFVAIVTFCAAIWRGKLNSEQIRQQKRQNDANDDANLAKLLQEGAKLLGEDNKTSYQLAGIATFKVLISDPKKRFSIEAMDLLADFYMSAGSDEEQALEFARLSLITGQMQGARSTLILRPSGQNDWPAISGFARQEYTGGTIDAESYEVITRDDCVFKKVRFVGCTVEVHHHIFESCVFDRCSIKSIDDPYDDTLENEFTKCDFSGCYVERHFPAESMWELKDRGNWFNASNPPHHYEFSDWERILTARKMRLRRRRARPSTGA